VLERGGGEVLERGGGGAREGRALCCETGCSLSRNRMVACRLRNHRLSVLSMSRDARNVLNGHQSMVAHLQRCSMMVCDGVLSANMVDTRLLLGIVPTYPEPTSSARGR
jgi:hypothetical protein